MNDTVVSKIEDDVSNHPVLDTLRRQTEAQRKKIAQSEELEKFAALALKAIVPRARRYFATALVNDRFVGLKCMTCGGLHASPVADEDAIRRERGFFRHAPDCPVAEVEFLCTLDKFAADRQKNAEAGKEICARVTEPSKSSESVTFEGEVKLMPFMALQKTISGLDQAITSLGVGTGGHVRVTLERVMG